MTTDFLTRLQDNTFNTLKDLDWHRKDGTPMPPSEVKQFLDASMWRMWESDRAVCEKAENEKHRSFFLELADKEGLSLRNAFADDAMNGCIKPGRRTGFFRNFDSFAAYR